MACHWHVLTCLAVLGAARVSCSSVTAGQWLDISTASDGSLPSSRTYHSMVAWNGSLFVFGGEAFADGISERIADLHEYRIECECWRLLETPVSSAPSPRYQHAMAAWGNDLFIFGGWSADANDGVDIFNDVFKYSLVTNSWRDVSEASVPPRYLHSMVAWSGKIYAFGGRVFSQLEGSTHSDNVLQVYDISSRSWSERDGGTPPIARQQHAMTVWEGHIFVFGGWAAGLAGNVINDLHEYDTASDAWFNRTTPASGGVPSARYDHSMTAWGATLYVFGGKGASATLCDDLHAYHVSSRAWVDLSSVAGAPAPRAAHGMAAWASTLFVFAGESPPVVFQDLFRLDLCVPECHSKATCSNATCLCSAGYEGDGVGTCGNVDECSGGMQRCDAMATCVDSDGSFECECNGGYVTGEDGASCVNVDECESGGHSCLDTATCTDHDGHYTCTCKDGYSGDGEVACVNVNECEGASHDCHAQATCSDLNGSFACECREGYFGNGLECDEAKDCNMGTHNCDAAAACEAEGEGFTCECNAGHVGNGTHCSNVDECALGTHTCHEFAVCEDTYGSFQCVCMRGYGGNGSACTNADECSDGSHACAAHANCTDSPGSYACLCLVGFEGNGSVCINVDECEAGAHSCHANGSCADSVGSFACTCGEEWTGDGVWCYWDACKTGQHQCHERAACSSWEGGHGCECDGGYAGNGTECVNVDECAENSHDCHDHAECRDRDGDFTCVCNAGFLSRNVGRQCFDVDECRTGAHTCHPTEECADSEGSFSCRCALGFEPDGAGCTDRDECVSGGHNCDNEAAECSNTAGSFVCACAEGWETEDGGVTCVYGEQCHVAWHNCDATHAVCEPTQGSFRCTCNAGWTTLDRGVSCVNVDECFNRSHNCHAQATCEDADGSFACACGAGSEGDGVTCVDRIECSAATTQCQAAVSFVASIEMSATAFNAVRSAYVAAVAISANQPTDAVSVGEVREVKTRRLLSVSVPTTVTADAVHAANISVGVSSSLPRQLQLGSIPLLAVSEISAQAAPPSNPDEESDQDQGEGMQPSPPQPSPQQPTPAGDIAELPPGGGGLSSGAAAGAAVGILGGLALCVVGFWFVLRYHALKRMKRYAEAARREEEGRAGGGQGGEEAEAATAVSAESLDLGFAAAPGRGARGPGEDGGDDEDDSGSDLNVEEQTDVAAKRGSTLLDLLPEPTRAKKTGLFEAYAAV